MAGFAPAHFLNLFLQDLSGAKNEPSLEGFRMTFRLPPCSPLQHRKAVVAATSNAFPPGMEAENLWKAMQVTVQFG